MTRHPLVFLASALLALGLAACAAPSGRQSGAAPAQPAAAPRVEVGGSVVSAERSLFDNLAASDEHGTLEAALRAGGMVNQLRGAGPFTLFAPTDAAFAQLPAGQLDSLLDPANKPALVALLNLHLVPGRLDRAALLQAVALGQGETRLTTAKGAVVTLRSDGGEGLLLVDAAGNEARLVLADGVAATGFLHAVAGVLRP